MAVVKIHSSRHVCVMLIGIVVSAIVFHPTQHCILKVGKFTRACPCRAFLQSLLSCLVHPYLLRNLFQLLFYSFRQVRFWAWIGATKMDPLGGTPSVRRKYAGIEDHCHLGRWDLPFAIIVFPQCLKMGLPGAAFFGCRDAVFSLVRY